VTWAAAFAALAAAVAAGLAVFLLLRRRVDPSLPYLQQQMEALRAQTTEALGSQSRRSTAS